MRIPWFLVKVCKFQGVKFGVQVRWDKIEDSFLNNMGNNLLLRCYSNSTKRRITFLEFWVLNCFFIWSEFPSYGWCSNSRISWSWCIWNPRQIGKMFHVNTAGRLPSTCSPWSFEPSHLAQHWKAQLGNVKRFSAKKIHPPRCEKNFCR